MALCQWNHKAVLPATPDLHDCTTAALKALYTCANANHQWAHNKYVVYY